jgi:hypothetical protein
MKNSFLRIGAMILIIFAGLLTTIGSGDSDDSDNTEQSSPTLVGWGTPLPLIAPTTPEEAKQMLDLSAKVSNEFRANMQTLRQTMDANAAIQRAIDDLKNNPDVAAVTYQRKSLYIYTRLGDKTVILLDAQHRENPNALTTNSLSTTNHNGSLKQFKKGLDTLLSIQSVFPAGNKKALIFSGYQADFGEDLCPIKAALESGGFLVDFLVDVDMCGVPATAFDQNIIRYITQLNEYDVIYFNTHGDVDFITLAVSYDPNNASLESMIDLLLFKVTNPGSVVLYGNQNQFGITSDYIRQNFQNEKSFKNTLVFADACHTGTEKTKFAGAFLDNGAAVYIGYNNTAQYNRQTPQFTMPLFQRLNVVNTSLTQAVQVAPELPTHWSIEELPLCFDWLFGCFILETEGVDAKIYTTQTVQNDPEGFVLVPFAYRIANVLPNSVRSGDTLVIQGQNFNAESHQGVYLYHRDTALVEPLQVISFADTEINVTIPDSVQANAYELYVGDYILNSDASYPGYPLTVLEAAANTGVVEGLVEDALTRTPLAGTLVRVFQQGNLIQEEGTGANGRYNFVLLEGNYVLEISLANYLPATVYINVTRDETTTVTSLRQVPQAQAGNGSSTGQIRDAFNGDGIANATLNIREGVNVASGTIIATAVTDNSGLYTVDLLGGNYTIEVVRNGYTTGYFPIVCIGGAISENQNASVTPLINTGELRIVLTWGEQPGDLDSHLLTSDGNHIYYDSRGNRSHAKLDVDRSDIVEQIAGVNVRSGPETITIYQSFPGTYYYYVKDYTASRGISSPGITNSRAKIEIHSSTGLVKSYNVPLSGNGLFWEVFSYDGTTGTITTINQITTIERDPT